MAATSGLCSNLERHWIFRETERLPEPMVLHSLLSLRVRETPLTEVSNKVETSVTRGMLGKTLLELEARRTNEGAEIRPFVLARGGFIEYKDMTLRSKTLPMIVRRRHQTSGETAFRKPGRMLYHG